MHFLGLAGMPRRYPDFTNFDFAAPLMPLHKFMTHAAYTTAAVQLLFLYNLWRSLRRGDQAPANPWRATTLEWTLPSPPPRDNFGVEPPAVHHGPYEYSVPGAAEDFILQSDPTKGERTG
jgi:cytochrome c oxidase subunit 1